MGDTKRDTYDETIIEIVRQLGNQLIKKTPDSDEKDQLYKTLYSLQNFIIQTIDSEPEVKRIEYEGLAGSLLYPDLAAICKKNNQPIIISLERFEEVLDWASQIHIILLKRLLRELDGVELHFVLFVRSDDKPRLFYGSNKYSNKKSVTSYRPAYTNLNYEYNYYIERE